MTGCLKKVTITTTFILCLLYQNVLAAQCNITSTPMNFGAYDPMSTVPLTATGSFNISCKPNKQLFNITLQLTSGNSGSFSQRNMASGGGDQLFYNIYANATQTSILGDGSGGSVSLTQTVSRQAPWDLTFYGQIPALQNVTPGVYNDLLTATILW
jgi:spore coat protein U-like protein